MPNGDIIAIKKDKSSNQGIDKFRNYINVNLSKIQQQLPKQLLNFFMAIIISARSTFT